VNLTAHPTAAWTAQRLREAWPWDTAPRFVIRDRDRIYGSDLRRSVQQMGVDELLTAPRSPWLNPFVERVRRRDVRSGDANRLAPFGRSAAVSRLTSRRRQVLPF
jgi:hypothetical protein